MGVTVEDNDNQHRIADLRKVVLPSDSSHSNRCNRDNKTDLRDMNWIFDGGESGPGARPIRQNWVESLQKQALKHDIPFFFKQWGGTNKKKSGKLLNGKVFKKAGICSNWHIAPTNFS
jgi:protein gp37